MIRSINGDCYNVNEGMKPNKKVFLHERKRHITRRVASPGERAGGGGIYLGYPPGQVGYPGQMGYPQPDGVPPPSPADRQTDGQTRVKTLPFEDTFGRM